MEEQKEFYAAAEAVRLAQLGIKVYPTVPGKKTPFKGSHGQKDASNDYQTVWDMFAAHRFADVSIKLENMIVLDVDNHTGNQEGLTALTKAGYSVPANTRVESTPHQGGHIFFKYNGEHFNHVDLMPGVEVRGDQIKAAPSVGYVLQNNAPIQPAPEWLVSLIEQNRKPKYQPNSRYVPGQITFIGKKLNSLMDGVPEGSRNIWLSQQIGFLLGQGVQASHVHELMWWITQTKLSGNEQIRRSEFDATFRSVFAREQAKLGGVVHGR